MIGPEREPSVRSGVEYRLPALASRAGRRARSTNIKLAPTPPPPVIAGDTGDGATPLT
ncbi:MAG: hypothetical protein HY650_03210 [Acidobacteria bacterium]|nr:hypothetical protein [Acidobacteriota bacterium]